MNTVDEFVDAGCVSALAEEIVFVFLIWDPDRRANSSFGFVCCVLF